MHRQPGPEIGFPYRLIHALLCVVIRGLVRIDVRGREHLPAGAYVAVANHLNWIDPFLLAVSLPLRPKQWALGAHDIVWNHPFKVHFFTIAGGVIPINRNRSVADRTALAAMLGLLRRGGVAMLFPEGSVGHYEGRVRPFKHGASHLALATQVPIVPIGINGTGSLWYRKRVIVCIGEPIAPGPVVADPRRRDLRRDLTRTCERAVKRLLVPPGELPAGPEPSFLRRQLNPWANLKPPLPPPEAPSLMDMDSARDVEPCSTSRSAARASEVSRPAPTTVV